MHYRYLYTLNNEQMGQAIEHIFALTQSQSQSPADRLFGHSIASDILSGYSASKESTEFELNEVKATYTGSFLTYIKSPFDWSILPEQPQSAEDQ